jgi:probable rRNA maturation factor
LIQITLSNRQRTEKLETVWLRRIFKSAVGEILKQPARKGSVLAGLGNVDVVILSNRVMAGIHRTFMNIEGPTDVITFKHGEILICAEIAATNAKKYQKPLHHEIGLYIIHGLLHLNGYNDKTQAERRTMQKMQERILAICLEKMNHPASLKFRPAL